jgi:threonine dehydrogenase-like Zn-dependent dehydrogenase
VDAVLDNVKTKVMLATDRAHVIREAILCCRKGGTVSVPGVYVGMIDKMPGRVDHLGRNEMVLGWLTPTAERVKGLFGSSEPESS